MKEWSWTMLNAFLDVSHRRCPGVADAPMLPIGLYCLETGSCEGCAMELEALDSGIYGLEKSGFRRVHRPEQADWLLVTGAVSRGRADRLGQVWSAMPEGRSLIAIGECAINGGPFRGGYATLEGLSGLTRVQRSIAGCPPAPADILAALIGFRLPDGA